MGSANYGWRRHNKDLLLIVLIVLVVTICFADVIFAPLTFYYQDIQFLHYPGKIFFVETLGEGDYGFWNPYIFAGYPLQAEPEVGSLYPFNFFFALPIPPYYAQTLFVVLHYAMAAVFTYLLARSLRISRAGSMVAALVFACSGFMMAQLTNFSILTASVWLPLILLLFSMALRRRSYWYAVATGAIIALFILTAHPQFILLTMTVLGLYYVYSLAALLIASDDADKGRAAIRYSLFLVVAVVVGVALSAPQLLPAFQLQSLSVLSESLGFDFVTSYSLSPYRMVSFLFPNFLGNQATGYSGPAFYEEHHNYVGLLPLVLAGLAWARRREKDVLFFGLLLILSVVLSWGRLVPIYYLIARMPLYNLFRVPARWLYPMTLALAMLAGFGFDHLVRTRGSAGLRRMARVFLILAGLLTLTLPWVFVLKPQIMEVTGWFVENVYPSYAVFTLRSLIKAFVRFPDLPPSNLLLHAFPFLINPLIHFLVVLDLSAVLLYLFVSDRLPVRWFGVAAIALIAFDLSLVGGSAINPVEPASYFDKRDSTAFLQENVGLHRVYPTNQDGDPNLNLGHYFPMIYRVPSFGGSSSLTVRWAQEYRDAAKRNPRLYDLAGVKYVLEESENPPEGFSGPLREAFSTSEIHIWENPNVMPRAFIVHSASLADPGEDGASPLENPSFPLESEVLLDDPDGVLLLDRTDVAPSSNDVTDITYHSYNEVVMECQTDAPGFLVLTDSYYPGWEARIDDHPTPIYRAYHAFRAVHLPPGHHTVTFRFVQPVFWQGVALAAAGAFVVVAAGMINLLRKNRGGAPNSTRS